MNFYVQKFDNNLPKYPMEDFINEAEKLLRNPFCQKHEIPRYPLTNIGSIGTECDKKLVFQVALAGFKPENIKMTYVGNVIKVVAKHTDSDKITGVCWVQQNITYKDALREFRLPDNYMDCKISSKYVNGMLTIVVTPLKEDPTEIEISTEDTDIITCKTDTSDKTEEITPDVPGTEEPHE